ncbi:MAG: FkbM family methyltransferase [Bryobacterales bacterium]|nr:FkbM family methyltransferase [Bryobacterales bacterium]
MAILLLIAAGVVVRTSYPEQSGAAWQSLSGQSPHCSLSLAWMAPSQAKQQVAAKDAFIDRLKLGARDQAYERWDLSNGAGSAPRHFWIPAGNRWILPFNLAEQLRDIYQTSGAWGIREGDVVLDCGAHVGAFTHQALARGAAKVIAIEPSPRNVECLRRNFAREIAEGRVVVFPKGVWNREEVLVLHQVEENSAADTVVIEQPGARSGDSVPLTRIDTLVQELALSRVDYIKMDIEGAEVPALEGAAETMRRWKPRLALAAYHKADDPVTLPAIVHRAVPEYRSRCASCILDEAGLRPEVILMSTE